VREVAALVRASHAGALPHRVAPELGEHTASVLRWLGYDDERIDALAARGSAKLA
jgi:crotonobetainyl-CoA:carnitine CoA-transferase CaiB-like acyl-CoA transferase